MNFCVLMGSLRLKGNTIISDKNSNKWCKNICKETDFKLTIIKYKATMVIMIIIMLFLICPQFVIW